MTLNYVKEGIEYTIDRIDTGDSEMNSFLTSLGCYSGEPIKVLSRKRAGCVVAIRGGRYSFDKNLAERITVQS